MNRRRFVPHAFFVYGDDGSEDFVGNLDLITSVRDNELYLKAL